MKPSMARPPVGVSAVGGVTVWLGSASAGSANTSTSVSERAT